MKRCLVWRGLTMGLSLSTLAGCGASQPGTTPEYESLPPEAASTDSASAEKIQQPSADDAGHGGRLFDRWYAAADVAFTPDDPSTEALDGKGGPFDNGTLPDADGKPMPNTGHDYRLKNLLGWDLRGAQGIYGPDHADKPGVLLPNLMSDTDTRAHWIERLSEGGDAFPAYGKVLSPEDIAALVDFLLGVRDGTLPQPGDIYELRETDGHYALAPVGNPDRGDAIFREKCARCHGADGAKKLFDDGAYSLGTLSRSKGYEVAMKVLSGEPGTPMKAQVSGSREAKTGDVRDLLAALCNRTRYPKGEASADDVPDGDPRCGAALK